MYKEDAGPWLEGGHPESSWAFGGSQRVGQAVAFLPARAWLGKEALPGYGRRNKTVWVWVFLPLGGNQTGFSMGRRERKEKERKAPPLSLSHTHLLASLQHASPWVHSSHSLPCVIQGLPSPDRQGWKQESHHRFASARGQAAARKAGRVANEKLPSPPRIGHDMALLRALLHMGWTTVLISTPSKGTASLL